MHNGVLWLIAAAITLLVAGTGAGIRLAVIADEARRARARETAAAVAQHGLLFGFAAVAAAISAHGLVGLIHELGHILIHDRRAHSSGDSTAGCRGIQKIEADSVAFIVATRLGMDTSAHSLLLRPPHCQLGSPAT